MSIQSRMTDVNDTKIRYELDETGMNPDNYILNEIHTVSSTRYRDYNIIIPEFPPFYTKDIKVRYKKNAHTDFVELHEGADFSLGLFYKGATRVIGMPVYGCLLFNNLDLDGIVQIDYRTLGGDQLVDRRHVLEKLINNVWNPREKGWEYVTDTPNVYPPVQHPLDWENIYRLDSLVKQLKELADILAKHHKRVSDRLEEFLATIDINRFYSLMDLLENHSYTDILNTIKRLEWKQDELDKRLIPYIEFIEKVEHIISDYEQIKIENANILNLLKDLSGELNKLKINLNNLVQEVEGVKIELGKKQDKLDFVGIGPKVMKTGAFGVGDSVVYDKFDINNIDAFSFGWSSGYLVSSDFNLGYNLNFRKVTNGFVQTNKTTNPTNSQVEGSQELHIPGTNELFVRTFRNGSWSTWEKVYHTGEVRVDKKGYLSTSKSGDVILEEEIANDLNEKGKLVPGLDLMKKVNSDLEDYVRKEFSKVDNIIKDELSKLGTVDQIFIFESSTPPPGFIARNGQAIDPVKMPGLYKKYGTHMPDDRNRYLRMQGSLTGGVGSTHEDAIRNIKGKFWDLLTQDSRYFNANNSRITKPGRPGSVTGAFIHEPIKGNATVTANREMTIGYEDGILFDASLVVPTASENRVKSRVVIFCNKIQ